MESHPYRICSFELTLRGVVDDAYIDGILPKGPYPPGLRMADRALLAGYPRYAPHNPHARTAIVLLLILDLDAVSWLAVVLWD